MAISVTHQDNGIVSVEATYPTPIFDGQPHLGVYEANVFDGFTSIGRPRVWAFVNYRIGRGDSTRLPSAEFCTDAEALTYLTALAELVVAANAARVVDISAPVNPH
jgi:hypothetical protein